MGNQPVRTALHHQLVQTDSSPHLPPIQLPSHRTKTQIENKTQQKSFVTGTRLSIAPKKESRQRYRGLSQSNQKTERKSKFGKSDGKTGTNQLRRMRQFQNEQLQLRSQALSYWQQLAQPNSNFRRDGYSAREQAKGYFKYRPQNPDRR